MKKNKFIFTLLNIKQSLKVGIPKPELGNEKYRRLNQRILENNPRVFIVGWASVFLLAHRLYGFRVFRVGKR